MEEDVIVLEGDEADDEGVGMDSQQGGEGTHLGALIPSLLQLPLSWRSSMPSHMLFRSPRVGPFPPKPPYLPPSLTC